MKKRSLNTEKQNKKYKEMTPKEKAKELVEKFSDLEVMYEDGDTGGYVNLNLTERKEAALITTEEVIYQYFVLHTYLSDIEDNEKQYKYWLEVKQEINKL